MKTVLYIPPINVCRCFRSSDLEAMASVASLEITDASTPETLREWLRPRLREVEVLITGWGTPPLSEADLDAAPALRAVIHAAGTVKRIVPACAWERGIRVAGCNAALAVGVAETTLGMIIAGLKGLFYSREWTRQGGWSDASFGRPYPTVRELFGLKIGVVSASQVGRHLLKLLSAFEVERRVYDPFLSASAAHELGAELVSLPELCATCDVVTVHAPALPETQGLISGPLIASLPDNAILINTARGNIVDQSALIRELETGRISAILDVTDPEPPALNDPLRTLPNVVLTSHLSGAVTNGCQRQGRSAAMQLREFLKGQVMSGEIRRETLATIA